MKCDVRDLLEYTHNNKFYKKVILLQGSCYNKKKQHISTTDNHNT